MPELEEVGEFQQPQAVREVHPYWCSIQIRQSLVHKDVEETTFQPIPRPTIFRKDFGNEISYNVSSDAISEGVHRTKTKTFTYSKTLMPHHDLSESFVWRLEELKHGTESVLVVRKLTSPVHIQGEMPHFSVQLGKVFSSDVLALLHLPEIVVFRQPDGAHQNIFTKFKPHLLHDVDRRGCKIRSLLRKLSINQRLHIITDQRVGSDSALKSRQIVMFLKKLSLFLRQSSESTHRRLEEAFYVTTTIEIVDEEELTGNTRNACRVHGKNNRDSL